MDAWVLRSFELPAKVSTVMAGCQEAVAVVPWTGKGVERVFLRTREVTTDNLSQLYLKARHTVIDHIRHVGGVTNVAIYAQLLAAALNAWGRYNPFLKAQR